MCKHCEGHVCGGQKVKVLRPDENGVGKVKIQGSIIPYIKNGDTIIVKFGTPLGEVKGVTTRREGDKFQTKLGVKLAYAKAIRQYITKSRIALEKELASTISQHDSLIDEITAVMPDTRLKRIRARRPHNGATAEEIRAAQ